MKTFAFEPEPSTKYVEVLDNKGNWIVRYGLGNAHSYIQRDIVYY